MNIINTFRWLYQLRKNQWLKPSELEELQTKKLRAIIKHAYENTEFYNKKFKDVDIKPEEIKNVEDLKKIPFTTKSELQKFGIEHLLAQGLSLNQCKICSTTGSSGIPLNIAYDKMADIYSKAINLRSMMENGLKIRDKWVNIGDIRHVENPTLFQKFGFLNIITLSIFDSVENHVKALMKLNPNVIGGYPSQLNLIAMYIQKNNIDTIKPRVVFTTAELLDNKTRKLINNTFNVELIDLFGCVEVNRTAWECSEHCGYHLDIDNVITEFINNDEKVTAGERGNIVYTSLYNYAMPLIRYQVGDVGIPGDELCNCGRGLPLMKSIEGRFDDFLTLPSGNIISPRSINVIEYIPGIIQYRTIQKKRDTFIVQVVPGEGFSPETEKQIQEQIKLGCLGEYINVKVDLVNNIPRERGKMRAVISDCK